MEFKPGERVEVSQPREGRRRRHIPIVFRGTVLRREAGVTRTTPSGQSYYTPYYTIRPDNNHHPFHGRPTPGNYIRRLSLLELIAEAAGGIGC